MARDPGRVAVVCDTLDLEQPTSELMAAVAEAVMNSGAMACLPCVEQLLARENVPGDVRDSLLIARQVLAG